MALDQSFFGLLGTFFAAIYGTTTVCALGFEGTLAHFFKRIQTGKAFRTFLIAHSGISLAIFVSISCAMVAGLPFLTGRLKPLTLLDLGLVIGIIAVELMRRLCRSLLQLGLKQRPMAYLEVCTLLSYVFTTWLYLLMVPQPTLASMLLILFSCLALSCLPYIHHAYSWVITLEEGPPLGSKLLLESCAKRLLISMHQVLLTATSSNLLIPLYALSAGTAQAATLKLITQTAHSIMLIIHHTFGLTGMAHLARSNSPEAPIRIAEALNRALYPLILFLIGFVIAGFFVHPLGAALCLLLIMQPLTMLYYQFSIIRGAFYLLLALDSAAIATLSIVGWYHHHFSFLTTVILLSCIQLSITAILVFIGRKRWQLPLPSPHSLLCIFYGFALGSLTALIFTNLK